MSDTFIQTGQPTERWYDISRLFWSFVRRLLKCWNGHWRVCSGVVTCAVISAMIVLTIVQPDNKSNYRDTTAQPHPHMKLIARTGVWYGQAWSVIVHQATSSPGERYHIYRSERSTCVDRELKLWEIWLNIFFVHFLQNPVESWLRPLHAKYLLRSQSWGDPLIEVLSCLVLLVGVAVIIIRSQFVGRMNL